MGQERQPARGAARPLLRPLVRREGRIEARAHDDIGDIDRAQDQARYDARDEQPCYGNAGEAAEQHGERRGRDQHVDATDPHDRPHRHARVVAAREHRRQHQAAEQRGGGDGRSRDRGEHGSGNNGDDRETARHAADDERECIDRLERHPAVKQHFAHQHEERDGRERETGNRLHRVARELGEPGLAAEKEDGADHVEREESEGDRQAEPHHRDEAPEQENAALDPAHVLTILACQLTEVASMRRVRSPLSRRSKRKTNSTASSAKVTGSGASSHHSGNTRFLMVIAPSRALSVVMRTP